MAAMTNLNATLGVLTKRSEWQGVMGDQYTGTIASEAQSMSSCHKAVLTGASVHCGRSFAPSRVVHGQRYLPVLQRLGAIQRLD